MENFKKWLRQIAPSSWVDLGIRTAKVLIIAFIALHVKEWVQAGTLDTPDIFIDALWVAGTGLALNAILFWARPS